MTTTRVATFGTILSETSDIVSRHWRVIALYSLLSALILLVFDVLGALAATNGASAVSTPGNLANIIISYFLAVKLLVGEGILAQDPQPGRLGGYFAASFMSGLGIILGMILLIVPGVMLAMRWYLASLFAITQGSGWKNALAASTEATAGSRWTLFFVQLVWFVALLALVMVVGVVSGVVAADGSATAPGLLNSPALFAGTFATNLIGGGASMVNVVLEIAVYRLLVGAKGELAQIFA